MVIVHGGEFGATKFAKFGNSACWVYNSRHLPVPLLSFLCLFYMRFYGIKWPPSFLYIRAGSSVLNPQSSSPCCLWWVGYLSLPSFNISFSLWSFFCPALLSWPIILFSLTPFEVFRSSGRQTFSLFDSLGCISSENNARLAPERDHLVKCFISSRVSDCFIFKLSIFFTLFWVGYMLSFSFSYSCCKTIIPLFGMVFLSKTLRGGLVFLQVFCLFKKSW